MRVNHDQVDVNKSRLLALIPKEHRLPGLLFLAIEAVFIGLAYGSDSTVKIAAILGLVVVASVFLLRFFPRSSPSTVAHATKTLTAEQSLSDSIGVTRDILSRSGDVDPRLWSLCQAVFDAFKAQSRKFKVFELRVLSGMNEEELRRRSLPFNLVLNGSLKMRMDSPYMIRTAYDASLLFAIMPGAISRDFVSSLTDGAKRLLTMGVDLGHGEHFDPWDTFLFVVGKEIDNNIKEPSHEDYVNVFLLTLDGRFINKSPHKWMDEVLQRLCLAWHPEKRSGGVN